MFGTSVSVLLGDLISCHFLTISLKPETQMIDYIKICNRFIKSKVVLQACISLILFSYIKICDFHTFVLEGKYL